MVTYMEPQTVPSYMSVKCTRRTLRMPSFTRVPHAQPSLSNFQWRDSDFGERTCSRGTTQLERNFPTSPKIKRPNLHIVRYTCQYEQYQSHRYNECRAHPSWSPTKKPTVSCWRYTPTPKQDRFQDLLEAICHNFLHTNLTKSNKYYIYSNKPQLLSAEVVLCTHKTTILCQFGLIICHQLSNSYLHQFSTILVGIVSNIYPLIHWFHHR